MVSTISLVTLILLIIVTCISIMKDGTKLVLENPQMELKKDSEEINNVVETIIKSKKFKIYSTLVILNAILFILFHFIFKI